MSCDTCSCALTSFSSAIPPLRRACELDCVHVELYITVPPSVHHCCVELTSLWHLAAPPYGETSFFKVSYFFCHNTYVTCYQQFFFHEVSEFGLRNKHPLKSGTR